MKNPTTTTDKSNLCLLKKGKLFTMYINIDCCHCNKNINIFTVY